MFSPDRGNHHALLLCPNPEPESTHNLLPVFGEHNERDHPADSRLARYSDPADKAAFLADLRHAARDIGFFYLINHGVDDALQYEVQRQSQRFLLSMRRRKQVAMIHSHFRGYNRAASELTRGQPDWREQFDIGAERPALTLSDDAPRWQRLQGPNLWPAALPSLKPVLPLATADDPVGIRLLRALPKPCSSGECL